MVLTVSQPMYLDTCALAMELWFDSMQWDMKHVTISTHGDGQIQECGDAYGQTNPPNTADDFC